MRTDPFAKPPAFWLGLILLCSSAAPLSAERFGLFDYRVTDGWIMITNYPEDAVGIVEIPELIDGKRVVGIGDSASLFPSSSVASATPRSGAAAV